MFKFNFNECSESNEEYEKSEEKKSSEDVKPSVKIEITEDQVKEITRDVKSQKANCFLTGESEIGYLDIESLIETSNSDLVPKVYEGGYKIWECTKDLADWFTTDNDAGKNFNGKAVCDLGCSAGILGILGLLNGAEKVDFQDYNEDVLEKFTVANVILNLEEQEKLVDFNKCAFYSGDWDSFSELTASNEKYDVIVTSETIYNPENYKKLLNFFQTRLKSSGQVFLSAKSYYFGVSGNVLDFCKEIESHGKFSYESLWKSEEGLQREILLLKFHEMKIK